MKHEKNREEMKWKSGEMDKERMRENKKSRQSRYK